MAPCAVIICQNNQSRAQEGITFHRFPTCETLRKTWLLSCGQGEAFDCSKGRVCSVHFSAEDFERDLKGELLGEPLKKRLKPGSVPHLNVIRVKQEPICIIDAYEIEPECQTGDSNNIPSATTHRDLDSSQFNLSTEDPSSNASSEPPVVPIVNTPVIMIPKRPSSLPASQNWEGPYNFSVSFGPQEKNTKGVTWTYSSLKDKLYVGKDVPCPVNFSANITPDNVNIRVMALYGSPEHASEIVHRCVNHSMEELSKKIFEAEHLVRCESNMAAYEIDHITKRHSVLVPFEIPPVGQHYSTYLYRFACFGSCAGGPNRRPIMLIFTLEKDGKVVGRRRLDVKICACPGRDRKAEEQQISPGLGGDAPKKRKESEMGTLTDVFEFTKGIVMPSSKKIKFNGNLIIKTDDKEQYDFLVQMKEFHIMCKKMKSMTPDLFKALSSYHRKLLPRDDDSSS